MARTTDTALGASLKARRVRYFKDTRTPREKIFEVSEKLIARHGVHGFRLQDVADQLGLKPPALYKHFASRDQILSELTVKISREIDELIPAKPGQSTMEAFRSFARRYVELLFERPAIPRLHLWEVGGGGVKGWEESLSIDSQMRERSRVAFDRAVRNGEFRDIRFDFYVATLTASASASVLWPRFDSKSKPVHKKRLIEEVDDLVVRLLSPGPASQGD